MKSSIIDIPRKKNEAFLSSIAEECKTLASHVINILESDQ